MKLLIKLILGLGAMAVLVFGALVLTIAYLDPNDFKETIAQKVQEQTGRVLDINGDIGLTYYPWLGLEVEGLSLSNAKGFGDMPMIQTKTVKVRAKLLPLLRKELEMDTLILHGATIHLAKNADGVTNWDDLTQSKKNETKQSKSNAMPFSALVLGGVDIKDANIIWQDKQQDVQYEIRNADVSTGELKLGDPIDLKAAMNISSSRPALSSDINFVGTVAYTDSGDQLSIKPMLLEALVKGKEVPGGEAPVKLSAEINVNMDSEVAQINALALNAFDTQINGQFEVANYQDKPAIKGDLDITGKDLPQLFKIVEIEPLASQLAALPEKSFSINTKFDADLKRNDIDISPLSMDILGNAVNAELHARNVQSESPAIKGKIKASGPNLPVLISIANQLKGADKKQAQALSSQLADSPRAFSIESEFDVDLKAGTANVPALSLDTLGVKTTGALNGKKLNSSSPELKGGIKISGSDLPQVIAIAAVYSGDGNQDIDFLKKQLSSAPKSFSIETDFDSDSDSVEMKKLLIDALGLKSNGQLKVKDILTEAPGLSGEFTVNGPDLPLLMLVAGSTSKDSALPALAKDLSKLTKKDFTLKVQFANDPKSGNIDLPVLSVKALGFDVNGNLKGKNIQASNGKLEGKLSIASTNPKPLLEALGQGGLAEVMQSININSSVNGNASQLALKPFTLEAVVSGKDIPNSPVTLAVKADSDINLDKEIFNLSGLSISGLGLDVKGNVNATQFKSEPQISGQLAVTPFDLRNFMQSLKLDVPVTADPKVLKRVGLSTSFKGKNGSLSLNDLKAELDDSKLQGNINLVAISPLNLEFGLAVDQFNLDRYLPPQEESKGKAATPETVAAGVATEIPVETLRAIRIKGDFVMGQLIVSNAKLSDMQLSLRAEAGDIKLAPAKAKLYNGTYEGNIHLDANDKQPKLTMDTNLSGVQIEPLLNDVVGSASAKGAANIKLSLSSQGEKINKLRNSLSGKGKILIDKGTLIGVDVKSVLHQVEIMIENKQFGKPEPGEKTDFDKLTATLDIHNGVIDNKDLLMLGSGFNVAGKGMLLNLHDQTWKYTLIVKADPTRVEQGEKSYNIGGHEIPIQCSGKITDKNCTPDVGAIAGTVVKKAVVDKLLEGVGIDTGVDKKKNKKDKSTDSQETQPGNVVDELLKGGLEKLF